jgi:2-keto-myo-inositol isomerase
VLVDGADRLGNLPQIRALLAAGFDGPYSFEPFAPEVHDLADPAAALGESIDYLQAQI